MIVELIKKTTREGVITYYVAIDEVYSPESSFNHLEDAMLYFEYVKKKHSKKDEIVTLIREEI